MSYITESLARYGLQRSCVFWVKILFIFIFYLCLFYTLNTNEGE